MLNNYFIAVTNVSISVLNYSSIVFPSAATIFHWDKVVFEALVAPAKYFLHVYYVYLEDVNITYFPCLKKMNEYSNYP